MTLRNRIGVVSALAVLGALTLAAPASAATTHKPSQPVAVAPSPSTPGDGAPADGAPADGGASGGPAAGSGQPSDLPTLPPTDLPSSGQSPAAGQGSGDGSVKSPAAESGNSSSGGGNAMWFGIGGGLLAGIVLGVGFVVLRKRKGTAATGGQ